MLKKSIKTPNATTVFLLAIITATIIFLPFIIMDKGYFFYMGDFNVQQVPFYMLAHDAVRSGDIFWNWFTDLGVNFQGSYSFYLLFSPFFWITLLFPNGFVPFLMAPLLILKTGCAALFSYLYIKRFVKDQYYALIGGLLYAFSGFLLYNVFFNHFHEVAVFFPLLLIALEELIENDRRGFFALAVALNAMVNYWFFIGEVVFIVIYVFVRMTSRKDGKAVLKKFLWIGFESVIGISLVAFVLIPSVLTILGNPRTTSDNLLTGWNFWVYWQEQRPFEIIRSLFFPPDFVPWPNFFPEQGSKWSSLSAWLPLVSGIGVISYLLHARRDWLKKMILISFFMALIPGLNSAFIMFNYSYYARWFYMPILLFCVATVIAFENKRINLYRGLRWCTFAVLIFTVAVGFTPYQKEGAWKIGLMDKSGRFWLFVSIAFACLLISYLIIRYTKNKKSFKPVFLVAILAVSIVTWIQYIALDKQGPSGVQERIDINIAGRETIDLEDDSVYRTDFFEIEENMGMYWKLPNIQAFHSIVPTSIMEFYPEVGVKRDVSSKPGEEHFALRSLLSVKYLFIKESNPNQAPMEGFHFYKNQMGFNIYENENYLPFGFAYDYYFDDEVYENTHEGNRSRVMMRALYLEEDAIERNGDIIEKLPEYSEQYTSYEDFQSDVADRRMMRSMNFTRDNRGFTANIMLDKERLVFFSVPYEDGWSATVNGKPVIIEKANIGFMAVRVPAGTSEIRFNYMTNGLPLGLLIAFVALIVLILYLVLYSQYRKKRLEKAKAIPVCDTTPIQYIDMTQTENEVQTTDITPNTDENVMDHVEQP